LVYAPVGISNIFSSGSRHGLQNNSFEQWIIHAHHLITNERIILMQKKCENSVE
jgi:hypothetical protein